MPKPQHPGSVIFLQLSCPARICGVTDASGFASPYVWQDGASGLVLASSPDLIAALRPSSLDTFSVLEMLAKGFVSAPNTLYRGISEIGPGVRFRWKGQALTQDRWWVPPALQPQMTLTEAIPQMEQALTSTAERIAGTHGRDGWITVSAGMDSRYLACLLRSKLNLSSVTLGRAGTINAWTSAEVARELGLHNHLVSRPEGHYVNIALDQRPTWPSHHLPNSAHYLNGGLGDGIGPYLIGGYRADTLLLRYSPVSKSRNLLIARGELPADAPDWAGQAITAAYPQEAVRAITLRQREELLSLQIDPDAIEPTLLPLRFQRSEDKGHFEAARRFYPIYEPFLSKDMCDLAFALPADHLTDPALAPAVRKASYYAPKLGKLAKLPANPTTSPDWAAMIAAMRKALPRALWPQEIFNPGEWANPPGVREADMQRRASEGAAFLTEAFGLPCEATPALRPALIQIITAAERASGVMPVS